VWLTERLRASLQKETNKALERIRWDFKVREQAARAAKYMSLARDLPATTSGDYRLANKLAWEFAMWLPTEVYRELQQAMMLASLAFYLIRLQLAKGARPPSLATI
jgi:hypothetical protein